MAIEAEGASPEPAVFSMTFVPPVFAILVFAGIFASLTLTSPDLVVPYVGVSVAGLGQALAAATVVIIGYTTLSTKYRVVDGVLHIHVGPACRRIELESISRIRLEGPKSRYVLNLLGTRGIRIYYRLGGCRDDTMWVTPRDVDGFLAAIGARRTASGNAEMAR